MSQIINNGKKYKNRSKQGQHKIYKSLSIILVIIMILFLYPYKTTYNIQNQSTYLPKFNNASINITFNVINDEYSGSYGLWALGNYTKNIRAMPIGNYSYLAKVTENGTWRTFNGLKSPGKGLIEPSNGAGVFHEVYYAQVPGDLNSTLKSYGFIGTYNFNGSYQRLLAGEDPASQFNWTTRYFGTANPYINILSINLTIMYHNQTYQYHYNQSTNNSQPVSTGDIIT